MGGTGGVEDESPWRMGQGGWEQLRLSLWLREG